MNICSYIDMTNENRDFLAVLPRAEQPREGQFQGEQHQVELAQAELPRVESSQVSPSQFEEAAYLLRSLANEVRLRVVTILAQAGEMSVTELQESTRCEQSLLSHHLTGMRSRGILSCRRSGKNRFYSIRDPRVVKVLKCVLKCGADGLPLGGEEKLNEKT